MGPIEIIGMICGLVSGLALFLFGMEIMGDALKKFAGSRLKSILGSLTSSPIKGFLLGLGVTAIIQSSSATTVMVVGFVNSGVLLLTQTVGIIMGANLGTAVTAWLTGLSGLDSSGSSLVVLELVKASTLTAIIAAIGIIAYMFSKREKVRTMATILLGFAVLMGGMEMMSGAVGALKENEGFRSILTQFDSNPLLGLLAGTVLTAIVQSSSASIGILQALTLSGTITFGGAIPIIMGQNIGTCITAMLSSLGANKNARRAALVHLYFNIIGVVIWLTAFLTFDAIFTLPLVGDTIDMWGVAAVHTVFKLLSILVIFPWSQVLVKLACLTIKGEDKEESVPELDDRLLETPTVALAACRSMVADMAKASEDGLALSIDLMSEYDEKKAAEVARLEDLVDRYEDTLGTYLVKLSGREMADHEHREATLILHTISDLERISDHSVNILDSVEELREKRQAFSGAAKGELAMITGAVRESVSLAIQSYLDGDLELASRVEPLEQVVDTLREQIKHRHIDRLQKGECTIEMGFVLTDVLTNLERVSDHCSNLAGSTIETARHSFDMHSYLSHVRRDSAEYAEMVESYNDKYALPARKE